MDTPEDIITMDNGCVCCSVRGDLVRTLGQLSSRRKDFDAILAIIKRTGALNYTRNLAEHEADAAIAALSIIPESDYKQALIALAHIAVERDA